MGGTHVTHFRAQINNPILRMTIFLIEMAYTKLLIKSGLGLVSRIDFGIFMFQAKVTLLKGHSPKI